MPAIEPARLKMQVEALMEVFHQPGLFGQSADELLGRYADRTQRPGQTEAGRSLLPVYNTPLPVLQTILIAARPLVEREAETALACCEALWSFPVMETRLLAAQMLGAMESDETISRKILACLDAWCTETEDDGFRGRMIQVVLQRLSTNQPGLLFDHIKEIWDKNSVSSKQTALEILTAIVENPAFTNLPAVLAFASKAIRRPDPACTGQTLSLMKALVKRTPQEGVFLFTQAIQAGTGPETRWLVRQVLQDIPRDLAKNLRNLAHSSSEDG